MKYNRTMKTVGMEKSLQHARHWTVKASLVVSDDGHGRVAWMPHRSTAKPVHSGVRLNRD